MFYGFYYMLRKDTKYKSATPMKLQHAQISGS